MRTILLVSVLIPAFSLTGCMDPYAGVSVGYATRGDQPLTQQLIAHEDQDVKPRCERFARETNPSRGKATLAGAWNGLIGGLVGGAIGTAGNAAINGVTHGLATVTAGGAVAYAGAAAVMGGVNGYQSVGQVRHGWSVVCLGSDVTGLHYIPPSEAKAVMKGAPPRSYGYHPNQNEDSASASASQEEPPAPVVPH